MQAGRRLAVSLLNEADELVDPDHGRCGGAAEQ
jgi:hypothetical protein